MPSGCICGLLSPLRSQENNYGDTRHCHEMLPLEPSFYSWRFKQDPNNSAPRIPSPQAPSVAAGSLGPLAGFTKNPPTWGPAG